jgi:hypothetical protein
MAQEISGSQVGRERMSETRLVKQINRALADSGLKVRTARKGSLAEGLAGPYYVEYAKRAFQLRIEINELARALGVESEDRAAGAAALPVNAKKVAARLFANTIR